MGESLIGTVRKEYCERGDHESERQLFFSRIFERKGRLEIGRRLLKLLGSALGFLRIGVIAADLRGDGTVPEMREEWIIAVIRGVRD